MGNPTPELPFMGSTDRSRTELSHALVPTRVAWDWTGITAHKLYQLISSGQLKTIKIKKELYVDLDSLEAVLREESVHD